MLLVFNKKFKSIEVLKKRGRGFAKYKWDKKANKYIDMRVKSRHRGLF